MITIFNRAELFLTYDLSRFNQVRDTLEGAGLDLEEYCRDESLDSRTGEYRVYLRPPEEGGPHDR